MKKERSAQLKVGIFVLVSIAIFVYGVFTISGQEELFEKEYIVKTYFDNTAGLLEGAYVRLSGVGVGSVSSIRFSDDPSQGKVQVVMEVNKRALARVSTDSLATIKTEGLLGAKFVEIIPGQGESIGKARDGIVIRGYTSPEMQEIISQSEEFVSNLTAISRNLDKVVAAFADETNPGNARNTLLSMQESFQTIAETVRAIEKQEGFPAYSHLRRAVRGRHEELFLQPGRGFPDDQGRGRLAWGACSRPLGSRRLKGCAGGSGEKQVRALRGQVYDRRKGEKGVGAALVFPRKRALPSAAPEYQVRKFQGGNRNVSEKIYGFFNCSGFLRRAAHGSALGSVLRQGFGQFHFASGPAARNRRVDVHRGLQGRPGGSEIDASGGP